MTLAVREAYQAWAPTFNDETAVSWLDDAAVRAWPHPDRGPLLDLGCGTGRRLSGDLSPAEDAVGVDLSVAMLRAGRARGRLAAADALALPFRAEVFATVWCRLMIGHVAHPEEVYRDMARVARPGATVIVTDFHPDAIAAGHTRSFRDQAGALHIIEHHTHTHDQHAQAAAAHGLTLVETHHGAVGPAVRDIYARSEKLAWYDRDLGLRLLLALRFRR
jgi:malonyl-CoA O-methyltransferase